MVDQEVVVSARITGIIESVAVDRGAAVKQGQVLATLDPRSLDADVREAREEMELRKAEFGRAEALSASKVTSAADLDEKKAQYPGRGRALGESQDAAGLRLHPGALRRHRDGEVRAGRPEGHRGREPAPFKITAVEPLLARVYVPEEELPRLRVGDRVEVVPDRFPDARTTGDVQFISPRSTRPAGPFRSSCACAASPRGRSFGPEWP